MPPRRARRQRPAPGCCTCTLEQVHHGDGQATWHVIERAVARGHGIRVGLEDTTVLPDGRTASGNAELVRAAAAMLIRDRGRKRFAASRPGRR